VAYFFGDRKIFAKARDAGDIDGKGNELSLLGAVMTGPALYPAALPKTSGPISAHFEPPPPHHPVGASRAGKQTRSDDDRKNVFWHA
jgi:hypothetical protein